MLLVLHNAVGRSQPVTYIMPLVLHKRGVLQDPGAPHQVLVLHDPWALHYPWVLHDPACRPYMMLVILHDAVRLGPT